MSESVANAPIANAIDRASLVICDYPRHPRMVADHRSGLTDRTHRRVVAVRKQQDSPTLQMKYRAAQMTLAAVSVPSASSHLSSAHA
ncbi:MAG: hypothetical protein R3E68_23460, partial [Burkholderiaceae bacterium]